MKPFIPLLLYLSSLLPNQVAATPLDTNIPDMTASWAGIASLIVFCLAYLFVMTEEFTQLRKSKPVILAAGIIWTMIAIAYRGTGMSQMVEDAVRHYLLEYAELGLFLLVAMTYINAMEERHVFTALRTWLVSRRFKLRTLFWITGLLAFFISPIADNLTTALLLCAVVMAMGGDKRKFIALSCINIVVAANAGGAFSPFGDITTLMVWQKGIETAEGVIDFRAFFFLFIPSLVNWFIPALIMSFAVDNHKPQGDTHNAKLKPGALTVIVLFLMTIATAVGFHSFLELPPVIGMLTGLAYLQILGYFLKMRDHHRLRQNRNADKLGSPVAFDIFRSVAQAEWDTLFFFYGVVLCVGGLGFLGYLSMVSEIMYTQWGPTWANIAVGILSAIVDNIPVMFAVLTMSPEMTKGQWLLVTMTAGIGGSLLSIGSAAGVGLMGQARGIYTFLSHLKWTPVIALGYAASIATHFLVNAHLFR